MTKKIIEINNLSKNFISSGLKIEVLKNINLKIETGKVVAILGPSGSGKSTFLHLISLLDTPTKGKIFISGKSITDINDAEKNKIIREDISIIFQNNNLLSDFTALENVAMPLIIRNENYKKAIKIAEKFLKKVNLGHRLNHFPSDLSGGEQQRVAIARALIAETKIILADEPTGNLDNKNAKDIFSYFLNLKEKNKIILIATHNRELAKKADYALSISDGDIKRSNV
ncbi:MAG: lipoprotein-releasing system ATP-binding protein LolD [Candidatus Pelagibacter sp. TMED196]|mgnify:CR=1 FL=1|nr:MAG: lipoprotein-releasing system ATP-binding protein LolD [Candidatus Pelagibacter sp. TMED196]|tara:strand:+ start:126 stop:809 length:684 start_codon:yes stop_codon:yes gene_type:complete